MLYRNACPNGAKTKRAVSIFKVAMVAIIAPAPAAALYIPQKPALSVLT